MQPEVNGNRNDQCTTLNLSVAFLSLVCSLFHFLLLLGEVLQRYLRCDGSPAEAPVDASHAIISVKNRAVGEKNRIHDESTCQRIYAKKLIVGRKQ